MKEYKSPFSEELIVGLIQNEQESWRQFCKHKYVLGTVWGIINKYNIPKNDFEDLFQDCVLSFAKEIDKNRSTIEKPENFINGWWTTIAERRGIDYIRKYMRTRSKDQSEYISKSNDISIFAKEEDFNQAILMEDAEFSVFLEELFKPFTPDHKRLYMERVMNKRQFDEIAEIFDISEDLAKKRFKALKEKLQKRYVYLKNLDKEN